MPDLGIVIQTVAHRQAALGETRQSLEASDVGDRYEVMTHQPGLSLGAHCLAVLRRMAEMDARVVARLEDDVLVNRHLWHNLSSWPSVTDLRFGVGWLFGMLGPAEYRYGPPTKDRWDRLDKQKASLGVVFLREQLRAWLPSFEHFLVVKPLPQDWALARVPFHHGRWICVHGPSLVDNNVRHMSTLRHVNQPKLGHHWRPDWRRQ